MLSSPSNSFWSITGSRCILATDRWCKKQQSFIGAFGKSPCLSACYYITMFSPSVQHFQLISQSLCAQTVLQYKCHRVCVLHKNCNVTPVMRGDCGSRLSVAGPALLLEGILSNVRFPFLRWSQVEVLCFPRRMRNALCLSWDDGKKSRQRGKPSMGK